MLIKHFCVGKTCVNEFIFRIKINQIFLSTFISEINFSVGNYLSEKKIVKPVLYFLNLLK